MMFYGLGVDQESRCQHYHSRVDIAALKCKACQKYYACYECHDAMESHLFVATDSSEVYPVLCGNCKTYLSRTDYETYFCPNCTHAFNPKCILHKNIYFKNH
nr:CHY zinc finger protein [Streptococcus merionis]